METKDHLYLAKLITGAADFGSKLKKAAFEYGCISPDLNPFTYVKGHTYDGTASYVRKIIKSLYGKLKTPSDYFDLGRAVHFIGDYFTFPHTPFFKGNLSEHVSYEGYLHKHIISSDNNILSDIKTDITSSGKCINLLEKMHERYAVSKKSISCDWNFIKFTCGSISFSAAKSVVKLPKLIPAKSFI